jgi:HK97 gp10 family phage protein
VISIKVKGIKECEEALNEFTNATARNVLKRVLFKAVEPVEKAAESRAPVAQGQLRSDIAISTQLTKSQRKENKKQSAVEVYVGVGGKRGPFAHLPEFGTAHSAPHPFMRPAIDANTGRVIEIFRQELNVEIEKAKERARRKAARLLAKGR